MEMFKKTMWMMTVAKVFLVSQIGLAGSLREFKYEIRDAVLFASPEGLGLASERKLTGTKASQKQVKEINLVQRETITNLNRLTDRTTTRALPSRALRTK